MAVLPADFSLTVLCAFAVASLVLAVTPGPGVLYVVAQTLAQGRRAGFASVAGVALGNLGNAAGASLGLAALFAVSALAFTVVKLAGAAYLVCLGIKALRPVRAAAAQSVPALAAAPSTPRLFRDGLVVALLNPKTALFFAAFLPQFIQPSHSAMAQSLGFGAVFVAIAVCTDSAYVLAASRLQPLLAGRRGVVGGGRWATAATLIGLGVYTAVSGGRHAGR